MGRKERGQRGGMEANFVSCVACLYCDQVSFDVSDTEGYVSHLRKAHNITKNIEKLLSLSDQEASSKAERVDVKKKEYDSINDIEVVSENIPEDRKYKRSTGGPAKPSAVERPSKPVVKNTQSPAKTSVDPVAENANSKPAPTNQSASAAAAPHVPIEAKVEIIQDTGVKYSDIVRKLKSNNPTQISSAPILSTVQQVVSPAEEGSKPMFSCPSEVVVEKQNQRQVKGKNKAKSVSELDEIVVVEKGSSADKKDEHKQAKVEEKKVEKVGKKPNSDNTSADSEKKEKNSECSTVASTKSEPGVSQKKNKSQKKTGGQDTKEKNNVDKTVDDELARLVKDIENPNKKFKQKKPAVTVVEETPSTKKGGQRRATKEMEAAEKEVKVQKKSDKEAKEARRKAVEELPLPSALDINSFTDSKPKITEKKPAAKENVASKKEIKTEKPSTISNKNSKKDTKAPEVKKESDFSNALIKNYLPNIDAGAASGVMEKNDLDEVNDILDDWFKGEGDDDDDDDVPDELPEIDEIDQVQGGVATAKKVDNPFDKITTVGPRGEDCKVDVPAKVEEKEKPKEDTVPSGDCTVCGQLAKAACSGCKHVWYCTRDHQKRDWNTHKEDCKVLKQLPYRVERSPALGRFLTATRDLAEGELILQESPMVVGPRQMTKPVCLGCHKEISADNSIKCVRCNWPMCSRQCQDSANHVAECRATQAAGSKIKVEVFGQTNMMYACITVLRALALQEGPKKIWEDYIKFDSHLDKRIKTQVYSKVNKEKVVFFIHHYLGIKRYSDLEILEACGKLDTNCFEIRQNGLNLRAMYRTACLISHDCRPNTRHTFSPDHTINMYTTRSIKKGEVISATYTNCLWSTTDRREHLNMSKYFWCECVRCRDPTEFSSYFSAILCSRCRGFRDNVQFDDEQFITSTNPLNHEAPWRCSKCTNIQKASQIKSGNESVASDLKSLNRSSVESLVGFLERYENILGPTNHYIVEVKYALVSMLGNRSPYSLEHLTLELLQLKERLSRQLLALADRIDPGYTRWRGEIILELQMALVALAAGQAEADMITKSQAKEMAEEALQLLKTATAILQVEPDMLSILEDRMQSVSQVLAKWE